MLLCFSYNNSQVGTDQLRGRVDILLRVVEEIGFYEDYKMEFKSVK